MPQTRRPSQISEKRDRHLPETNLYNVCICRCWTLALSSPFWQAVGWHGNRWTVGETQAGLRSAALVHAHQQLHPDGDAGVPAQRQQADVAGHDGGAQQVLHGGGAVRVPVEDLRRR